MDILPGSLSGVGMQKFWLECPALVDLKFMRAASSLGGGTAVLRQEDFVLPSAATGFSSDQLVELLPALRLQILHTCNITLPGSVDTMFQRIDAPALQELTLNTVAGTNRLLEGLASRFYQDVPALKKLYVVELIQQSSDTNRRQRTNTSHVISRAGGPQTTVPQLR